MRAIGAVRSPPVDRRAPHPKADVARVWWRGRRRRPSSAERVPSSAETTFGSRPSRFDRRYVNSPRLRTVPQSKFSGVDGSAHRRPGSRSRRGTRPRRSSPTARRRPTAGCPRGRLLPSSRPCLNDVDVSGTTGPAFAARNVVCRAAPPRDSRSLLFLRIRVVGVRPRRYAPPAPTPPPGRRSPPSRPACSSGIWPSFSGITEALEVGRRHLVGDTPPSSPCVVSSQSSSHFTSAR